MQVRLSLGALAEPIAEQLADQGVEIAPDDAAHAEKWKEAYNLLSCNSLMTDGESRKVGQRIFNRIVKMCSEKKEKK